MNITTIDQAQVVLEVWSTTLTQHVSAMGIVLVIYDCLLTMQDEVCLILLRLGAVWVNALLEDTSCLARRPEYHKNVVLH
jgi:hypothetical protein